MEQTNRMQKWSKKIKENPIVEEEHKKKHADEMRNIGLTGMRVRRRETVKKVKFVCVN